MPTKFSPSGLPQDHPIFTVSRFHVDTQLISSPKSSITCECMTPGAFKFDGDRTLQFCQPSKEPAETQAVAVVMTILTRGSTKLFLVLGYNRTHGPWWELRSWNELEKIEKLVVDAGAMGRKKPRGYKMKLENGDVIKLTKRIGLEEDQLAITLTAYHIDNSLADIYNILGA